MPSRRTPSRAPSRWPLALLVALALGAHAAGPTGVGAQASPEKASTTDPRVGLKPGRTDAGVAAKNMTLVASLAKPAGFFDPKNPAGDITPPETPATPAPAAAPAAPAAGAKPAAPTPPPGNFLAFANSDLAFKGVNVVMGNFHGFNTYNVEDARRPKLVASIACPGGQGDVSIYGNLLFMSVEQTRGRIDCGTQGVAAAVSAERFRGVRIFDITDLKNPKQVAAVQTCRGSHTHTLVPTRNDPDHIYVYGSGTGNVRSGEELAGCSGLKPDEDPNTALFSIDVIKVPLKNPEKAAIVARPRIFADATTGAIAGLWPGGDHGPGTQRTSTTNQCHDITVMPEAGLAAGACSGNGILMDISNPEQPVRLDHVADKNFAYWHSATFNNDGTKIIFTDEWGGGTRPRCRASDSLNWGADAIFDIVDRKLVFRSYYKMPAAQTDTENCVAHNGSLIPVPGRDIMVQGWYQGGISVFDFTDSAKPVEIAYYDRGPIDAVNLITGGYWSAYWYNGHVYGAEIARGIDVFRLTPSEFLSENELAAANLVRFEEFNSQSQPKVTWPPSFVVAKAYLDQLERAGALDAARLKTLRAALDRGDTRAGRSAASLDELDALATQLETDAAAPGAKDAARMKAAAAAITARTARLR
ncbi:MAG: LVIVD repeat-containing protein [Vicinamibacterales bacterium]